MCLACCLAAFHPTQPSTKHTLLPTAVCCGFNGIDFIFLNIHIYVFKYISYLTVVISQTGAAHLILIWIHTARQSSVWGLPRLLTPIHGEKPPLMLWAPTMRGASRQRCLRDRHEMPLPSKVQVTSAPKATMVPSGPDLALHSFLSSLEVLLAMNRLTGKIYSPRLTHNLIHTETERKESQNTIPP